MVNVDVKLSGNKGFRNLKGVLVVESTYTYISQDVADAINPFEIKTMKAPWTDITVGVASIDIEIKNKKKRIDAIVGPDTFVGSGTLAELGC